MNQLITHASNSQSLQNSRLPQLVPGMKVDELSSNPYAQADYFAQSKSLAERSALGKRGAFAAPKATINYCIEGTKRALEWKQVAAG